MDGNGLNNRNWGCYDPSQYRPNLGFHFQLIPSFIDRNENPNFLTPSCNGGSTSNVMSLPRDYTLSDVPFTSYSRLFSNLPNHHHSLIVPETGSTHPVQLLHIPMPEDEPLKRRQCSGGERAAPRAKKVKDDNVLRMKRESTPLRKSIEMVINGVSMDIGSLPVPVCSCTGMSQLCYRWGCGGWQSACCTTNVSMHPLPMSTKRRGARIAGRKMSLGAFRKVLEKLSADGFDFSNPIDLKSHWAKHGTNKFVTIR